MGKGGGRIGERSGLAEIRAHYALIFPGGEKKARNGNDGQQKVGCNTLEKGNDSSETALKRW